MKLNYTLNSPTTIQELCRYIMAVKEISNAEVAEKLNVSDNTISVFLSNKSNGKVAVKNPFVETIKQYFDAIGEQLVVLDSKDQEIKVPDNVLTLNKLINHVDTLRVKTSLGTFEIVNEIKSK